MLEVRQIEKAETHEWLLMVHYAACVPTIDYAFGLFQDKDVVGVCTFGRPPNRHLNDGMCLFGDALSVRTLELNRLVVISGLPKNSLSFFVARCLDFLP